MPMFRGASAARRSSTMPISSHGIMEFLGLGNSSDSGANVTPYTALNSGAYYRATSVLAGLSGSLPMHSYKDDTYTRKTVRILKDPHPEMTAHEFKSLQASHRCGWGNFYAYKQRNGRGDVEWLLPFHPSRVRVFKDPEFKTEKNPTGKMFAITREAKGEGDAYKFLTPYEVFHVPHWGYDGIVGVSPVQAARQAIGLALTQDKFASKLFSNGALKTGVLQTDQRLNKTIVDRLKAQYRDTAGGIDEAATPMILDAGMKFEPLSMPNSDAQFLESRMWSVGDISRWFGVGPFLMYLMEKSTSWGTGLEEQMRGFVTVDLHPQWLSVFEQRATKELLPADEYAKFNLRAMLRGNTKDSAEWYRTMLELGIMNPNEARGLEELERREGGDEYYSPMNLGGGQLAVDKTGADQ